MFSKPPPPPPSSPELDESALITAAVLVVLTIAALLFSNKAAMPPLKTPKELAAAKALFVRCAEGYAKCYGLTHEETLSAQEAAAGCI